MEADPPVCTQTVTHLSCFRNYRKVRERCRKGIPPSCRARAWLHLCGAKYKMESGPATWRRLLTARADQSCTEDIEKDLHRNFPTHELFGGEYEKIGRAELYKVLRAYSVHNPSDGYCQAQVGHCNLKIYGGVLKRLGNSKTLKFPPDIDTPSFVSQTLFVLMFVVFEKIL